MTPEQAKTYRFDPFDITKVWPHADFPPIEIGRMVLDRNPENYFAEVEQAAFSPANFVPGIGPSPGQDAPGAPVQLPRHPPPPARAQLPPAPDQRPEGGPDGELPAGRRHALRTGTAEAGPTTGRTASAARPRTPASPSRRSTSPGQAARHAYVLGDVDFVQAGALYRKVMTDTDREHLVANIVGHLKGAQKRLQLRQTALFYKADPEYGERVAKGLGLDLRRGQAAGGDVPGGPGQGDGGLRSGSAVPPGDSPARPRRRSGRLVGLCRISRVPGSPRPVHNAIIPLRPEGGRAESR